MRLSARLVCQIGDKKPRCEPCKGLQLPGLQYRGSVFVLPDTETRLAIGWGITISSKPVNYRWNVKLASPTPRRETPGDK
jgi:hypothetical protein